MDYPEPTLAEIHLLARLVSAMDAGRDAEMERLRGELRWPLSRLMRELRKAGILEWPQPLPLP